MSSESISFSGLLYAVLLREKLTPTRLATNAGISPTNVDSWLRDGQLPKATSVWKLAAALPKHRLQLFAAALQSFHSRTAETYKPGKQLRWDKTVSTYMGEGFDRIPPGDHQQFSEIWRELLAERVLATPAGAESPIASDLILLPVPSVVLLNDWREITKAIVNQNIQLVDLPWKKFEDLVGHLLESFGWEVTPMGYTKDNGIDLIAVSKVAPDFRLSMMVQCKRFSERRKVGVELVREIWSVKWEHGFHQAMLATTSSFTSGAKQKGELWNLDLRDQAAIADWCKALTSGITH